MSESARRAVGRKSTVTPRLGKYVGHEGLMALVDLGDQRVPVQFGTAWVPDVNDPVWVDSVDGQLRLSGSAVPKPGKGVVSDVDGDIVTVVTAFGEFQMPYATADPPGVSDPVGIVWSEGARCFKVSTDPDAPLPPPDPNGSGGGVKSAEFRAIDAGSTDRGSARWWQAQPWASSSTYGAWFYGTQIKDTIPAGATFVSLEFYASWQQRSGGLPRFTLHADPYKSGVPAMTGYTEWAPTAGWSTPPDPAGWFNALKAGGSWWGVGLNQGGFNQFRSLAQDGFSGALRISWR